MSEEKEEFTASAGATGVSLSAKGKKASEVVAILSAIGVCLLAYMLFIHGEQAKETNAAVAASIKELASAQRNSVAAQREMTCIISLPQEKREAEFAAPYGFCKRMSAP